MEVRLVPVNTRDGVDTRPLDGEKDLTTRVGAGDHVRGGQTAALTYLLPPGAEVEGSNMWAFWTNYLRTADDYIKGDPLEHFKFTTFEHQQGFNEADIKRECFKLGAGEEMLTIYRQFYNRYVTEYLADPTPRNLKSALDMLADYNKELEAQQKAATLIQQAYRASKMSDTGTLMAEDYHGPCVKCEEPRMGDFTQLCADCYWSEDAVIKKECRYRRQNAIPSGGY